MKRKLRLCLLAGAVGACAAPAKHEAQSPAPAAAATTTAAAPAAEPAVRVPIESFKLDNGLRVVLSEDKTAPVVIVAVYYGVGFRVEPRDRTGFSHLFEHMMFQGSQNLGKMQFIKLVQSNGGILNGSTRFDFTNYFEVVPSNVEEMFLWGEADRMKGLAVTQANLTNQQGVVESEVRVNVMNAPYGGFPWLDLPQAANKNWRNAHNFYGDMKDLDHASLDDVKKFFAQFYAPNNAVLVVNGDIDYAQTKAWVQKYFASIPRGPDAPKADISEPRQDKEIVASRVDKLAKRPAVAVGYHMPERHTPDFYAMALIQAILADGDDSLFYRKLVHDKGLTDRVNASANPLGNQFDYAGPMLWEVEVIYDPEKKADDVVGALDEVLAAFRAQPPTAAMMERARIKVRSQLYGLFDESFGLGRADLLACYTMFDDDPQEINRLEHDLMSVTPEQIQKTAAEYLRPTNRTVFKLDIAPAANTKAGK
jgi:zinc protease